MKTAPELVEQTYAQKIANNAEVAFKSGSTWVVAVAGVLLTLYTSLDDVQKEALVSQFPVLKGWLPVFTVIAAFIVAKLKPSNAVSTSTKALIEEVARLRMNAYLRQQGAPELPAPPPTPLPVVPPEVAAAVAVAAPPPFVPPFERRFRDPVDIDTSAAPRAEPPRVPIDNRLLISLLAEALRVPPPPR